VLPRPHVLDPSDERATRIHHRRSTTDRRQRSSRPLARVAVHSAPPGTSPGRPQHEPVVSGPTALRPGTLTPKTNRAKQPVCILASSQQQTQPLADQTSRHPKPTVPRFPPPAQTPPPAPQQDPPPPHGRGQRFAPPPAPGPSTRRPAARSRAVHPESALRCRRTRPTTRPGPHRTAASPPRTPTHRAGDAIALRPRSPKPAARPHPQIDEPPATADLPGGCCDRRVAPLPVRDVVEGHTGGPCAT
jgi:hypothetical protein